MSEKITQIEVPQWWHHGDWLTNRDCLPPDHPESTYQYIKKHYPSVDPEEFGVPGPDFVRCPNCDTRIPTVRQKIKSEDQ